MERGGFQILIDVSAVFPRGRSSVIAGPSGSGKSILLKVAGGLIPPDSGSVLISGEDLSRVSGRRLLEHRASVGFVFEDSALWQNKTVAENIALPIEAHRPDISEDRVNQDVRKALDRFGLSRAFALRPSQLSEGEQKVISFLRALSIEPEALFMDEPLISVDHSIGAKFVEQVRSVRE